MIYRQFEGRSAAEAAIKACEDLHVTRAALHYEIVSDTGEALGRRVVIRVATAKPGYDAASPEAAASEAPPYPTQRDTGEAAARGGTPHGAPPAHHASAPSEPGGLHQTAGMRREASMPFGPGALPNPSMGRGPHSPADAGARDGNFALSHEAGMPPRRNRVPERVGRGGRGGHRGRIVEGRSTPPDRHSGRGDRGGAGERGHRSERGPGTTPMIAGASAGPAPADARRGRRGGNVESRLPMRDGAGDRPRERARPPTVATGRASDDNGIDALLRMDATPVAVAPRPAVAPAGPRAAHALHVLGELLRLMHVRLEACLVAEDAAEMHIDLTGADEARVIGRKGEVLLALQFVLNRIISRNEAEGEQVVVLDAGSYRERRRVALQDLAAKLASRALEVHKAVRLSPMSAHDRRIFHTALKQIDGIVTRSEGEGLYRNLLIIPVALC